LATILWQLLARPEERKLFLYIDGFSRLPLRDKKWRLNITTTKKESFHLDKYQIWITEKNHNHEKESFNLGKYHICIMALSKATQETETKESLRGQKFEIHGHGHPLQWSKWEINILGRFGFKSTVSCTAVRLLKASLVPIIALESPRFPTTRSNPWK
jgi:hypothetical protein